MVLCPVAGEHTVRSQGVTLRTDSEPDFRGGGGRLDRGWSVACWQRRQLRKKWTLEPETRNFPEANGHQCKSRKRGRRGEYLMAPKSENDQNPKKKGLHRTSRRIDSLKVKSSTRRGYGKDDPNPTNRDEKHFGRQSLEQIRLEGPARL